jgi:hypothetical protein
MRDGCTSVILGAWELVSTYVSTQLQVKQGSQQRGFKKKLLKGSHLPLILIAFPPNNNQALRLFVKLFKRNRNVLLSGSQAHVQGLHG